MKLQLALDFVELKPALKVLEDTYKYVDIIEAGTPLIKAVGLESVKIFKEIYPNKIIDADMKTADVGDLEVRIAADSGANIVHVMGVCPIKTIQEAVEEAKKYSNVKIAVDLSGIKELGGKEALSKKIKEFESAKVDYLEVHTTISQQREGQSPFEDIKKIANMTEIPLAVAGGINADTVAKLKDIKNLEIIIVGGAITNAVNPKEEARKIKEIINSF